MLSSTTPLLQSTTPENTKHHRKHTNQKLKNTTTNTPSTFYARHLLHQTPLQKHLLSDLLHLTNTIIAVRKDIQYCFSIFSCVRNKTQPLQSAKTYDLLKHLLSDLLHLTNTTIAVRKDIQYCFYIFSYLRGRSPQRHTT